jgi:predicted DNA-binding transcriptional regulator YafY
MADRVERLTNLLALLLEAREPVTLVQIAAELAGQYPDTERARRAAFERDKRSLREIGVPIQTHTVAGGASAGQIGYRIDRRAYELADLSLEPDEMRALQLAVATVRMGSTTAQEAIWKLGGAADEVRPAWSVAVPDRPELPTIRGAVATRSTIGFSYRGERRRLDPWGLLLRDGFWYVIGHDHDRDEQRTFRVDRFDGEPADIEVGAPGSFERPTSFDPRAAFPADPKQLAAGDDTIEVTVRISAVRADAVERDIGSERVLARDDDGIVVRFPASNRPALRSWVLGLLDHAVVLEPADVRDEIVAWLESIVEAPT